MPDLEIHINGIIQKVVSCVWYLFWYRAFITFLELFMLLHVPIVLCYWVYLYRYMFIHLSPLDISVLLVFDYYEQSFSVHLYACILRGTYMILICFGKCVGLYRTCIILYRTDKQVPNMVVPFYISSSISYSYYLWKAEGVNFGTDWFINIFSEGLWKFFLFLQRNLCLT